MKSTFTFCILFLSTLFGSALGVYGQVQVSQSTGCAPLTVTFKADNSEAESYLWTFSDGQTASVPNPSLVFDSSGIIHLSLSLTYKNGDNESFQIDSIVTVQSKPIANFSVSQQKGCINEPIEFTNESAAASSYVWNFGDGNQSSDDNPTYRYQAPGIYHVSLRAISAGGCDHIVIKEKLIEIQQQSNLEISASNQAFCVGGVPIVFTAISEDITQPSWDFGDGFTSNLLKAEHAYQNPGIFKVKFSFVNQFGCNQTVELAEEISVTDFIKPEISIQNYESCVGQTVTAEATELPNLNYEWLLSDGRKFSGRKVKIDFTKAGTYQLQLKLTDGTTCEVLMPVDRAIQVQNTESIVLKADNYSGCAPFTFSASNNTANSDRVEWLVDGKTIVGKNLTYEFQKAGNYQVQSINYFKNGCVITSPLKQKVQVLNEASEFKTNMSSGCAPVQISLALENTNATAIRWLLGDGTELTGKAIDHTYQKAGKYYPIVEYTNKFGCFKRDTLETAISVFEKGINLGASDTVQSCTFTEVYFSGSMGYEYWEWDFGDGNSSEEQNPVHVYEKPGIYTVNLSTQNKNGCETEIAGYNIIEIPDIHPEAEIEVVKGEQCGLFSVHLATKLQPNESAYWFYNLSMVGTKEQLDLSFFSISNEQVILKIEGSGGCSRSKSFTISNPWKDCTDEELPPSEAESDESTGLRKQRVSGCNTPFTVDFMPPSDEADLVRWTFNDGTTVNSAEFTHDFEEPGLYTIDLYVEVDKDSSYFIEDYVTVQIERGVVDFNYTVEAECEGYRVRFSPNTTDMEYFFWKVNNQPIELDNNDNSYFFEDAGLYQISLEASGTGLCKATQVKNIYIGYSEHVFDFDPIVCLGDPISVNQSLEGFKEFIWMIEGQDSIKTEQLLFDVNTPGSYKVELLAKTLDGCYYHFPVSEGIQVFDTKAKFSIKGNTYGCGEHTVQFISQSTDAKQYLWTFGNGITSTEENPKVTFNPGTYTVNLEVSAGNCSDTFIREDYIVVDELQASFSYEIDQTCVPVKATFTNESINGVSYLWDFGDGQTSTEKNPVHMYERPPSTAVSLIVTNDKGCEQKYNTPIAGIFVADFTANETVLCIPSAIQFESSIPNAVAWLWSFGDGATSSDESPLHEYVNAGLYDVELIATSTNGCVDTVKKASFIQMEELKADFEVLEENAINCVPSEIAFSNNSIGATKFLWNFGDGTQSEVKNPVHIYNSVGNFDVTLMVWNEIGCIDTLLIEEMITTSGPETKFTIDNKVICMPDKAIFRDASVSAISWIWYFGDGNTSSEKNPQHKYEKSGWYKARLIATNENGCTQSYQIDSIRVIPTPEVRFDLQIDGNCSPVQITTKNLSSNLENATYTWEVAGIVSQEKQPDFTLIAPGDFEVKLTVENQGACPISYVYPQKVLVRDTISHDQPEVKLLSADDYSINIDLAPYSGNNVKGYKVYRNSGSGMRLIKRLDMDEATSFKDEGVKPNETIYEYVFQAIKYCEDTLAKDDLLKYNNLRLERKSEGSPRYLAWNKHEGNEINNYRIFIRSDVSTEWTEIAIIDPSINNFGDSKMLCAGRYYYKVAAFADNNPVSVSNQIVVEVTPNDIKDLKAEVKNTTVIGKNQILTEWQINPQALNIVQYFEVYRAIDDGDFELIDQVQPSEQLYIDEAVVTSKHAYSYKIKIINTCDIESLQSNATSSLLLKKESRYNDYKLNWKLYSGWEAGVLKYLLQKQNAAGEWETIQETPADQTEVIIIRPEE